MEVSIRMNNRYIVEKEELRIDEYENAFARPNGGQGIISVYDQNGQFIPYTSKRKYGKAEYSVLEALTLEDMQEAGFFNEEVVYLGFFRGHWGHFIVDSSIRLWALEKEEYRNKRILMKIEGMETFYQKFLGYLGISREQIIQLEEPARFKKIIIPQLAYFPKAYISRAFLSPFRRVSEVIRLDKKTYDKIYLSRVRFARSKKELGERRIQSIFEENGYQVLYPEELSLEEQIWYYKNCKEIVTTNGTIAHNVVYAKEGIRLVMLKRFKEENTHQLAINQICGIDYIEVDCYDKKSNHNNSLMLRTPQLMEFCRKNGISVLQEGIWQRIYFRIIFNLPYLYKWFR